MLWLWVLLVAGLTLYRVIAGFVEPLPLHMDEAQYVGWSHHLAAGYFSKPPMIAWTIAGGNGLCTQFGINAPEGCARMLQPVAILIAAIAVTASTQLLYANRSLSFAAGILFASLPITGFYSLLATTDAWLLMFWSLAFYFFMAGVKSSPEKIAPWIGCGIATGLGILSKYSMGAFVISALVGLWISGRLRSRGPWIAAVIAMIVFSPNLIWNITNGFPTFVHHVDISKIQETQPDVIAVLPQRITALAEFLLAQFFIFGPALFGALIYLTFQHFKNHANRLREDSEFFLLVFIWPLLGLAIIQAFMSRAHANWAAPAYVTATILATAFLFKKKALLLLASALFGLLVSIALIHLPGYFYKNSENGYKVRFLAKMKDWREAALWVKKISVEHGAIPITEDRQILAAISAYSYPQIPTPYAWNPQGRRDSHFTWFLDAKNQKFSESQRFLFLLMDSESAGLDKRLEFVREHFKEVTPVLDANPVLFRVGDDRQALTAYLVTGPKTGPKEKQN